VLKGFVLAPGRDVARGDVIEVDHDEVRVDGIVIRRGPLIHPSILEPIVDEHESPARDAEPTHRDPEVRNRDPRPRRRRGRGGS
jgi:hypothetical protein